MNKKNYIVIILTFLFFYNVAHAQESIKDGDSIKNLQKRDLGLLYDHIVTDLQNKKYLKLSKQGWLAGPGGSTYLRFGGFVQINFIQDFQNTGISSGEFVPAEIPVPTDQTKHLEFDPRTSRVTFETQTDTKKGVATTFIGIDFNGSQEPGVIQLKMRQLYFSYITKNKRQTILVGQASTTFMDGNVWPEQFDYEGPNSMLYLRQIMVRYTFAISKNSEWIGSVALEQPKSSVQNATGLAEIPDLVFTANWQQKWGHIKMGAIGRQLMAENEGSSEKAKDLGFGLFFSGHYNIPSLKDNLQYQLVLGSGTGRYIQGLGDASIGQDAVYNANLNTLNSLGVFSAQVSYQHWWIKKLRSTFIGGLVDLKNQNIQENDALKQTVYISSNIMYSPFDSFDMGFEYYWGQRENKDKNTGFANRLMLSAKYAF